MSFIKRLFSNNLGVIAMETVMTLPIYLVLLGGGAWISELTTGKNALATAQYSHFGLFGVRNIDITSSNKILNGVTNNVANSNFLSFTHTVEKGWWHEVTVNDGLTMTPDSLLQNMFKAMGPTDMTQASLTNLTITGDTHVRYVRSYNGDWRGSEYGNVLCNGLVNDIYNQLGPGDSPSNAAGLVLSITPVSYYKSNANEYHKYLY